MFVGLQFANWLIRLIVNVYLFVDKLFLEELRSSRNKRTKQKEKECVGLQFANWLIQPANCCTGGGHCVRVYSPGQRNRDNMQSLGAAQTKNSLISVSILAYFIYQCNISTFNKFNMAKSHSQQISKMVLYPLAKLSQYQREFS